MNSVIVVLTDLAQEPINSKSFEFLNAGNKADNKMLSGSLIVGNQEAKKINEISRVGSIDKLEIVYNDYLFLLIDTLFSQSNESNSDATMNKSSDNNEDVGNNVTTKFTFMAKDIQLMRHAIGMY